MNKYQAIAENQRKMHAERKFNQILVEIEKQYKQELAKDRGLKTRVKSRVKSVARRAKVSLQRAKSSLKRMKSRARKLFKRKSKSKSKAMYSKAIGPMMKPKSYNIGAMQFAPVYQAPRRASAAARSIEWA